MRMIHILLILFCINLCANAQNTNLFKGRVIEKATKLPIAYASIKLSNSKINAISNAEGDFKIVNLNDRDTLMISSLGFSTVKVAISNIQTKVFELVENVTLLSDVEIKPIDAVSILSQAVKTSNASYASTLILKGYYKEYVKRDSFITKYADGMINYFIQRREGKDPKILLKVLESRAKVLPVSEEDDKYDAFNSFIDIGDQAKFISPANASPLNSANFGYYDYKIYEIEENGVAAYLISFKPRKGGKEAYFEGKVYIDKERFLIKSVDYKVADAAVPFLKTVSFLGVKISSKTNSFNLKYAISNNEYYLAYLNRVASIGISSKSISQVSIFKSEFLTTGLQTKDCIPFTDGIYNKRSLFKKGTSYSTEFWKQPNLIVNTTEEAEFILNEK